MHMSMSGCVCDCMHMGVCAGVCKKIQLELCMLATISKIMIRCPPHQNQPQHEE